MNNTEAWNFAIGLTRGAGLEPTEEFKECIEKEKLCCDKLGKMTMEDLKLFLDEKYKKNKVDYKMNSLEKYHEMYQKIARLQPDETLQLVLEAETEEEKVFFELISDFLLQIEQKKVIEKKLF